MDDWLKVKLANSEVHARVRAIRAGGQARARESAQALAFRQGSAGQLIEWLEREGARVEKETKYDLD